MTETPPAKRERPLSPHLQVYKLPMTANMSILHRMSGVVLSIGTLLVFWVLIAAATGEEAYDTAMMCLSSPVGILVLFGWSAALCYHMCTGIRHLFWDTGHLFKRENAKLSGYVVFIAAILLTAGIWYAAYNKNSGLQNLDMATLASNMQDTMEGM